jgi:uncharacterized membrane protein YfcA
LRVLFIDGTSDESAKVEVNMLNDVWKAFPVFLASIYGGYFGGGLSVIVLAVLALVLHESLTRLNALKQVIALCVNGGAAIFFLFSGKVIWSATIVMAIGALVGGRNRRTSGRLGSTLSATRDCCGVLRGGNLHLIFRSIRNRELMAFTVVLKPERGIRL